ncbi:MAG: acetate--CoA ligase family protein, partial [Candidatus Riflebacteria bacterium]|nr:acetate--CoA ligase family protein [Candidatus Riflebacteria bacterium]
MLVDDLPGSQGARGLHDDDPFLLEGDLQELPHQRVVVHDEHPRRRLGRPGDRPLDRRLEIFDRRGLGQDVGGPSSQGVPPFPGVVGRGQQHHRDRIPLAHEKRDDVQARLPTDVHVGDDGVDPDLAEQVEGVSEVILGCQRDPVVGPVVLCGLGGIHTEVLGDVALRIPPLTDQD